MFSGAATEDLVTHREEPEDERGNAADVHDGTAVSPSKRRRAAEPCMDTPSQTDRRMPLSPLASPPSSSLSGRESAVELFLSRCVWNAEFPHVFKPSIGLCNSKVLQRGRLPRGYIITTDDGKQSLRLSMHGNKTVTLTMNRGVVEPNWVPIALQDIASVDDVLLVMALCALVLRMEPAAFSHHTAFYKVVCEVMHAHQSAAEKTRGKLVRKGKVPLPLPVGGTSATGDAAVVLTSAFVAELKELEGMFEAVQRKRDALLVESEVALKNANALCEKDRLRVVEMEEALKEAKTMYAASEAERKKAEASRDTHKLQVEAIISGCRRP